MELDADAAQSVRFSGRTIVALATDPNVLERTGEIYTVTEVANAYGVIDPDKE